MLIWEKNSIGLLQLYKIPTSHLRGDLVCGIVLHSTLIHLPYRGLWKTIPRKGNIDQTIEVDDQEAMVHYHLALRRTLYNFCYLVTSINAWLAAAALDARKTSFCSTVVLLPRKKSFDIQATSERWGKIYLPLYAHLEWGSYPRTFCGNFLSYFEERYQLDVRCCWNSRVGHSLMLGIRLYKRIREKNPEA